MPVNDKPLPDKWHYTWEEFDMHTQRIVGALRASSKPPSAIICLGRGGAPLGAALANTFGIRMYYWGLASYNPNNEQESMTIYQSIPPVMVDDLVREGKQVLLVDDIWDTGRTFEWAARQFPEAKKVCLIYKPSKNQAEILPTIAPVMAPADVWVEFPWEKNYG